MTALEKAIDKASKLLAKREDENEYHLHDVDRKWVIEAMMDYAEYCLKGTSSQTEISDDEIFKQSVSAMEEYYGSGCETEIDAYFRGAIWYREQLKKK